MSKITPQDVKNIASLSRIHLRDEEIGRITKDLERILGYVEKLNKLDVSHVQPTSHPLPLKNVYREDIVKDSLSQERVMKLAVKSHKGSFQVPKVIE